MMAVAIPRFHFLLSLLVISFPFFDNRPELPAITDGGATGLSQ